jgi:hypothetical protein
VIASSSVGIRRLAPMSIFAYRWRMSHPTAPQPSEQIHPKLLELYRQATVEQKLAAVGRINASLQALKAAELVRQYPTHSPRERLQLMRHWWLGARD